MNEDRPYEQPDVATTREELSEESDRASDQDVPTPSEPLPDADTMEAPLFQEDQTSSYRTRWDEIQARFVDDPQRAVQDADELVSNVVAELEATFKSRSEALEAGWQRGDDVSTEDLRMALRAYRSFFGRLLGT